MEEVRKIDRWSVLQAIHLGDREVAFCVDKTGDCPYLVTDVTYNACFGTEQYDNSVGDDDYLEAVELFLERVRDQLEQVKAQRLERQEQGVDMAPLKEDILISDIPAGTTIIAKELRAPEGYALDGTPQTVRVEAGETHTLSFYDKPLCNLTILKRDSATKQPLSGAEFLVTDGAGAPIGPNNGRYTSGSDGLITITGLTPGMTVIVREEKAPWGYVKDGEPKTVTVQSGKANSLTFDNAPKGTLIIVKLDGDTKKPLEGAVFQVTTSSGELVATAGGMISSNGMYTTDKNGKITLSGLEPDTYVITETRAPDGYAADGSPQTVVVNTNDTQTLTFVRFVP